MSQPSSIEDQMLTKDYSKPIMVPFENNIYLTMSNIHFNKKDVHIILFVTLSQIIICIVAPSLRAQNRKNDLPPSH